VDAQDASPARQPQVELRREGGQFLQNLEYLGGTRTEQG